MTVTYYGDTKNMRLFASCYCVQMGFIMKVDLNTVEDQIRQGEALSKLISEKNELLKSLLRVEKEIAVHTGSSQFVVLTNEPIPLSNVVAIPTTKTPAPENYSGSKRGRKPKGEMSLANHILLLVEGNASGLDRSQIVTMLLEGGYKSSSIKFADVVASTLSVLKSKSRVLVNDHGKFIPNR